MPLSIRVSSVVLICCRSNVLITLYFRFDNLYIKSLPKKARTKNNVVCQTVYLYFKAVVNNNCTIAVAKSQAINNTGEREEHDKIYETTEVSRLSQDLVKTYTS